MSGNKKSGGAGHGQRRGDRLRTRVRTAKGRKLSSTRWLERQLNDPYVAAAKKDGYPRAWLIKSSNSTIDFRFFPVADA